METRLIIVRHGETKWNKEGRIMGQIDLPLSKNGIEQAKKVSERLKNKKIDLIVTSKLKRAIKTAEIINKYHNLKIEKCRELNERTFGILEGIKRDELALRFPEYYQKKEKDLYRSKFPKGESYYDLEKRAIKKIKEILRKNKGKTILLVTHGGVKIISKAYFFKKNLKEVNKEYIKHTSVTEILFRNNKPKLIRYNCTKHL